MAEPELKLLHTMVQRVLDDQKTLREYLEVQFSMIRSRDSRIDGHGTELRAVEAMLGGHWRRIAALEARQVPTE